MNIRNVREKFKHFETLSIAQLSQVTGESPEDLSFVVSELKARGRVIPIDMGKYCGSGCSCSIPTATDCSTMDQLYQWIK